MLLWLWITSYAILLGAEINAESEQQTVRDTTKGPDAPLGERDAVKADSLPPAEEARGRPKSPTTNSGEATMSHSTIEPSGSAAAAEPGPRRRLGSVT